MVSIAMGYRVRVGLRALLLTVLVGVTLAGNAGPASGQEGSVRSRISLGLGLGAGAGHDDLDGMAVLGRLQWLRQPHAVALRFLGIISPFDAGSDASAELGLLYGRTRAGRFGHVSLSAGLAATSFDNGCSSGTCTVAGVPIVAEAALRLLPVIGVGAQGYVNLNSRNVYGGLLVFAQLGWLP